MPSLILAPPVPTSAPVDSLSGESSSLLPPFLSVNSRITYKHEGAYHKGFLTRKPCGVYPFSFKTHVKKKSEDWGVDLPNLPFNWKTLDWGGGSGESCIGTKKYFYARKYWR